jgi:ribosomal protein L37E
MAEVFCARCGLEAPIDEPIRACTACGYVVFVPARYLDWDASLTEKDRDFLRANKIALT